MKISTKKEIKNEMKKLLFLVLFSLSILLMLPAVHALSYSLTISYESGKFNLNDILLSNTKSLPASLGNEYSVKIISFYNKILFQTTFNRAADAFFSIPLNKNTMNAPFPIQRKTFSLVLPYFSNAKKLQILQNNNLLLEIDLSKFSVCNENNICDNSESLDTCPEDCTCGNKICDPNENYLLCSIDCKPVQGLFSSKLFRVGFIFIILIFITLLVWQIYSRKSKNKKKNSKSH